MKRTSIFRYLILVGLSFAVSTVVAYDRTVITFGSVIRLKHKSTGKYLTATDERYVHKGSSGQPAVYGSNNNENDLATRWIIKGVHSGDRWNYALNGDRNLNSMIGWPVHRGSYLRLENVATGRNLHSHGCISPCTNQKEVTNLGDNGLCNTDDNFIVENNTTDSGWTYLASGYQIKLRHQTTGGALHSHVAWWQEGKQEVTTYAGRDDNDWWWIELIQQPTANEKITPVFESTRSTKISYWSPVFWDTETDGCTNNAGDHRVWAHGGSRHDSGDAKPPHDHMELILGPWSDERARRGPSFFIIQNADDKFKKGPVSFGDKIKIMAVNGGRGEEDKAGLLKPFRYLWMHPSRWGAHHREVIITRPDHGSTQGNDAVFVLEPIIDGQTGAISTMDLVRIKNVGMDVYLWAFGGNRWGGSYWEILADKGGEDTWGRANYGAERRIALEKFRFSLVQDQTLSDDTGRSHLKAVNDEIVLILGAEAANQKAIALTAEKAQLDQKNAELKTQLEATKAEEERLKSDNAKQLEDLKKSQADALAKAQADAEAILAKAKSEDAAAQAAAQAAADKLLGDTKTEFESQKKTLVDQLASEKAEAKQMLQDAKDALEDAKKQAEEDSKKKVDALAAAAKAELDKVMLQAADLAHTLSFPIGFIKIPGKAKSIAFGLQDNEGEKIIDNKGNKEKILSFDDFGVILLSDDSLAKFKLGADVANPWERVDLKDDKGVAIKAGDCGVGLDGTTFVISRDGKSLYGINWPGDTAAAMPDPSLGFKLAAAKEKKREEKAIRKRKGKKNKKHKRGAPSLDRGRGKIKKFADQKPTRKHNRKRHKYQVAKAPVVETSDDDE